MGHVRVGKLPKVRGWNQVVALLDSGDSSSSDIAAATAKAAKDFISQKSTDPSLVFSYWLLNGGDALKFLKDCRSGIGS